MLVGRTTECACIETMLESARTHGGEVLLLRGGPGVGKTALLRFAREQAAHMTVLESRPAHAERAMGGAALSQLEPDLDAMDPARCAAAFRQAAGTTPLLLLVDDAQWLDPASGNVLAYVARRLRGAGIAMLVATRENDTPAFDVPHDRVLALPGLDLAAAAALLRASTPAALPPTVLERLHAQCAGNPLALLEVPGLLTGAQPAGTEPLPDPPPLGPRLQRALAAPPEPLPTATRRALVIAAAHGGGDVEPLVRALHARGLALRALEHAEAVGIMSIAASSLRLRRPAAPLRRLPPRTARAAPRRARRSGPSVRKIGLGTARTAPRSVGARTGRAHRRRVDAAAGDAQLRAAPAVAGRALEAAARLTPDPRRRTKRLIGQAARIIAQATPRLPWARSTGRSPARTRRTCGPTPSTPARRWRACGAGFWETHAMLIAEADRVEPFDRERAAACSSRPRRSRSRAASRARASVSPSGLRPRRTTAASRPS